MHRSAIVRIAKVAPAPVAPAAGRDHGRRCDRAGRRARRLSLQARDDPQDALRASPGLDHYAIDPNPLRDPRVKLPKERKPHIPPPLAEHVERVAETVARNTCCRCSIDECGPRVSELETCEVGDLDEHRRAIRVRWTFRRTSGTGASSYPTTCSRRSSGRLPPREDRDLGEPLFPDLTDARLRMAITRACKATGTPHFSPHGLRRRRGSLHYKRTGSLAEVAELLGDSKRVAADHYVYALTEYREVDRSIPRARPCAASCGRGQHRGQHQIASTASRADRTRRLMRSCRTPRRR